MLIKEHTLQHWLDTFYGFGSWQSPIWFVGYEEGGGDLPEEVAEKFDYLYNLTPTATAMLCDLRDLYKHVTFQTEGPRANQFATLYDYRFGDHAILHGIWKNLIAFTHAYEGQPITDLLTCQKDTFALACEALIALYPLPSPHNHAWYYSWLNLPQKSILKTRKRYEEYMYPQRIQTILNKIEEHAPRVVLMYDMSNINQLKRSIQEFFPGTQFTMVKGTKQEIPQHHKAIVKNTTLVITTQTPALKRNRIDSGYDWARLAKSL